MLSIEHKSFRIFEVFELDSNLRYLVQSWLLPHDYCLPHKELPGRVRANRGIK